MVDSESRTGESGASSEGEPLTNPIGPLTAADEWFSHQVVDTFAVVGTSDLSWTEKVCAMAAAKDGSLQLGFGFGKYTNRNVTDGYGGISRGVEQITVRASRRLSDDLALIGAGPLRYEIVEPLRQIRFVLEPNDVQPIAFDWLFTAELPATLEDRTHNRQANRVSADLVRYHQIGTCSGWVEIDGVRTEMTPESWVSTRDHSWGVRYDVGEPANDLEPSRGLDGGTFQFVWSPILMERPDASVYGLFLNVSKMAFPGFEQKTTMAMVEHPDGRTERIVDLEPELTYDPVNRRLRGGTLHATLADGIHAGAAGRGRLRHRLPPRRRSLLRLRRAPPRRVEGRAERRGGAHRRLHDCRERPSPPPDPRHRRPRHRPGRRWRRLRQHAAHRHGRLPRTGPRRRVVVHVSPGAGPVPGSIRGRGRRTG